MQIKPLTSLIIEPTNTCNLRCTFCFVTEGMTRKEGFMDFALFKKIIDDCPDLEHLCMHNWGEPLLHKDIEYITKKLSTVANVEVVTNGDPLNSKMLKKLYDSNAGRCLISMYDGPEQIQKFKKIINDSKVPEDFVILRDRWYDGTQNFGVKLTNRTGTVKIGNQLDNSVHSICYYPSYQFLIDWNGDVFLCPQDWQRRQAMGNMMQEDIFEIWTSKIMKKYRQDLLNGKRINEPCKSCNAQGTLLGVNHAKIWRKQYKI